MADVFYLARFRNAHENGLKGSGRGTYEQALQEIKNGRKMGHWMWYIFPQPRGFGHTQVADFYGIRTLDEARAYLQDETLNAHLREISQAVLDQPTRDARQLMGNPDWLKLAACMTLFDYVCPNDVFAKVLDVFYAGSRHNETMHYIHTQKTCSTKSFNVTKMEENSIDIKVGYDIITTLLKYCNAESITADVYQILFDYFEQPYQSVLSPSVEDIPSDYNENQSNESDTKNEIVYRYVFRICKEGDYIVITLGFCSMIVSDDLVWDFLREKYRQTECAFLQIVENPEGYDLAFLRDMGLGIKMEAYAVIGGYGEGKNYPRITLFSPDKIKDMLSSF